MLQNTKPSFKSGIIDDNKLWIYENEIQAFCKIDLDISEMEIVAPLFFDSIFIGKWMFIWKNNLFAVEGSPSRILVFNRVTLETKEIRNNELSTGITHGIANVYQQDNILILVPFYAQNSLWYFDMDNNQFLKDLKFTKYINGLAKENDWLICRSSYHMQTLWTVIYTKSYFLRYDMREKEITKYCFDGITGTLDGILYSEGCVWTTVEENSNIYRIKDEQIDEIIVSGNQSYSNIQETEWFIMVLPRFGDNVVMVDKRTLEVHIVALPKEESMTQNTGASKILNALEREHDIILFPNAVDYLMILNKKTFQIHKVQLKCSELYQKIKCCRKFARANQWRESSNLSFKDYINYILINKKKDINKSTLSSVGIEIYEVI